MNYSVQAKGISSQYFIEATPVLLSALVQKCRQECKKSCPVVRSGRLCIEVTPESKIAFISETLCIGCGICPKKCPFGAINIINLPTNLESHVTHRYSANSFKLHRLPTPRPGQVLGLVGSNGIGKSTALKILSGKLKPNLGRYDNPPDWQDVIKYFRGSELQSMLLVDWFASCTNHFFKITLPKYSKTISKPLWNPNMLTGFQKLLGVRTRLCEHWSKAMPPWIIWKRFLMFLVISSTLEL